MVETCRAESTALKKKSSKKDISTNNMSINQADLITNNMNSKKTVFFNFLQTIKSKGIFSDEGEISSKNKKAGMDTIKK